MIQYLLTVYRFNKKLTQLIKFKKLFLENSTLVIMQLAIQNFEMVKTRCVLAKRLYDVIIEMQEDMIDFYQKNKSNQHFRDKASSIIASLALDIEQINIGKDLLIEIDRQISEGPCTIEIYIRKLSGDDKDRPTDVKILKEGEANVETKI